MTCNSNTARSTHANAGISKHKGINPIGTFSTIYAILQQRKNSNDGNFSIDSSLFEPLPTNSRKQAHDQQDDDTPEHIYIHLSLQFTALVAWAVVVEHSFGLVTCKYKSVLAVAQHGFITECCGKQHAYFGG